MNEETHPILNKELYARAERAAIAAFKAANAAGESPKRRMQLMDRAARAVFKAAGTPRDQADMYACCITADILEIRGGPNLDGPRGLDFQRN